MGFKSLALATLCSASTALGFGPVNVQPSVTPGRFLLAWDAAVGRSYLVEASDDLADWSEVTRLSAVTSRLNLVEVGLPGPKTFWRVSELGRVIVVSPVRATYRLDGDQAVAVLSLTTGEEPPLSKVEFFSDGVLLGEAEPELENAWSYTLPAGEHPEIRDIHAKVTAEDGTEQLVPAARFLLADPARFVPAGPAGERRFGELVELNGSGRLDAFYFYPEGISDGLRESGAFFSFPAGSAALTGTNENAALDFSSAQFHRGPQDAQPIAAGAGPSPLRLASITPQEVNESFGRAPDEPLDLQFGGVSVKWEEGALGPDGWSGLKVKIPIGDFLLPGDQLDTEVVIGPGNSLESLVVTYAGNWRPMPEGPLFEVPRNDPLRLYLNGRGEIRARGTVIARLDNGGSLRGSVSWSPPFFEINLEGRKIIVPSLGALRGVLPTGSQSVVNDALAVNTPQALTAAEATLSGFQQTLAKTAQAAAEQAPNIASVGALLPAPEARATAAALAAWAARLSTWAVDRTGQTLTTAQTVNLTETVANAVKAAKGTAELSLIAAIWSNLIIVDSNQAVAGTGEAATALSAVISSSISELLAVRERLVTEPLPEDLEFLANHELPEFTGEAPAAAQPAAVGTSVADKSPIIAFSSAAVPAGSNETRERDVATREVDRKLGTLFSKLKVPTSGPAPPLTVETQAGAGVPNNLSALASFAAAYQQKQRLIPGWTLESPEAAQDLVTFEILTQAIESGLAAKRPTIISGKDFSAMQLALKQQVEYANSYELITGTLPLFDPGVLDLMEASFIALRDAIKNTLPRKRQALYTEYISVIGDIVGSSQSALTGNFLTLLLDDFSTSGDQFRALASNSPACDALLQALKASTEIPFPPSPPNSDPLADGAASQLALTGTYESIGSYDGYSYTLQINRAGQYLLGRMQEHKPRHQSKSWEIDGLLLGRETATAVKFSCLRFSGENGSQSILLDAAPAAGGINLSVVTSPDGNVVDFRRTSTRPFYSPQFAGRMTGEVRAVFDASIRAPLHRDQQASIAKDILDLHEAMLDWQNVSGLSTQPGVKRIAASGIDSACTRLLNSVSGDQIPLVRQFVRNRLSGVSVRSLPGTTVSTPLTQRLQRVEAGQKTQWTLLLEVFRDRSDFEISGKPVLASCALLLTGESLPTKNSPLYTYKCRINKTTLPIPLPVSGGGITFEIERLFNGEIEETMFLVGGFLQAGKGVEFARIADALGRFSGGTGSDEVTVTSNFRYTESDLVGPIIIGSAGGMVPTFGVGSTLNEAVLAASIGTGGLALTGPLILNKAPLILPLEIFSTSQEVGVGIGIEATIGIGGIVSFSEFDGDVDSFSARLQPLKGPPRRSFELGQQTVFATGSSDLTDCGWAQLRQFVAEYRAVLDDPAAKITIISLTDTVGSDTANLNLAERRNFSVVSALTRILGRVPGSDNSPIKMLPLGEVPARTDLALPNNLNATEAALLQQMRAELGTSPSGSPRDVPGWRVVKVLLNNTIFFDLNAL